MKKSLKETKRSLVQKVNKDKKKSYSKVNEGVSFYNEIGKIFIACGTGLFLILGFASTLPQDYEKYNIPLFLGIWGLASLLLIVIGIIPILLGKYSKKYQIWVKKEIYSYRKKLTEIELRKGKDNKNIK